MIPKLSVVICTKNRAQKLGPLLASIRRLDWDQQCPFEVVIVDNGSTDNTSGIIADFKQRAPFAVTYVYEGRPGEGRARNAGIRASAGDIILFTDDDCIVPPNWVQRAATSFSGGNNRRVVGGRIEKYDKNDADVSLKTSMLPDTLDSAARLFGFVQGCNLAIGRSVFDLVGFFDARFGPGSICRSGSDADFAYRAKRIGVPVSYDPEIVVFHHHGRSTPDEIRTTFDRYAVGKGAIAAKHLLRGDTELARVIYWEIRSAISACRNGRLPWRDLRTDAAPLLRGAFRFLLLAARLSPL